MALSPNNSSYTGIAEDGGVESPNLSPNISAYTGIQSDEEESGGGVAATFSSRTTGVAPLAVYFDAIDTASPAYTSGVEQPSGSNYAEFIYLWNFGDAGSGSWSTDSLSKNVEKGYSAAHVYESAGTYTVTLTVIDAAGVSTDYTQDVTVSAFSGTDYFISSSDGNDADDGLSEANAWATFSKVFDNLSAGRRFRFKRGDSFTVAAQEVIGVAGRMDFATYGAGAKPIFNYTANSSVISLESAATDIVVSDLEFNGSGAGASARGITFDGGTQIENVMLLRCNIHDFDYCLFLARDETDCHEGIVVAECTVDDATNYIGFISGRKLAFIGNTLSDGGDHLLRFPFLDKGVIGHNLMSNTVNDVIKLNSSSNASGDPATRFVNIVSNSFTGQVLDIAPQNGSSDERVTQVMVDSNRFTATASTSKHINIAARNITIRNNVFVGTGGDTFFGGINTSLSGIEPLADSVYIFNNTFYRSDACDEYFAINAQDSPTNVLVRNNFGSSPNAAVEFIFTGTYGAGSANSNNSLSDTPEFTNAAGGDFTLQDDSPALNAGTTVVESRRDFIGTSRPQGANYDQGAYERVA